MTSADSESTPCGPYLSHPTSKLPSSPELGNGARSYMRALRAADGKKDPRSTGSGSQHPIRIAVNGLRYWAPQRLPLRSGGLPT
jgi:hypothetical protein